MLAPWPVFQSLQAGQSTLACESSITNCTSGSALQGFEALLVARARGLRRKLQQLQRLLLRFGQGLEGGAAGEVLRGKELILLPLQRIELVEQSGGGEAQRGARLAGGPDIHQPVQHVFLLLQAQLIARTCRARLRRRGTGGGHT